MIKNIKIGKKIFIPLIAVVLAILVILAIFPATILGSSNEIGILRNENANINQYYGLKYFNTNSSQSKGRCCLPLFLHGNSFISTQNLVSKDLVGKKNYYLNSVLKVCECQAYVNWKMLKTPVYLFDLSIYANTTFNSQINYKITSTSNFTSTPCTIELNKKYTMDSIYCSRSNKWSADSYLNFLRIVDPANSINFDVTIFTQHGLENTYSVCSKKTTFEISEPDFISPCSVSQGHPFKFFNEIYYKDNKNDKIYPIIQDFQESIWYIPLTQGNNYQLLQINNSKIRSLINISASSFADTLPVYIQFIYNPETGNITAERSSNYSKVV